MSVKKKNKSIFIIALIIVFALFSAFIYFNNKKPNTPIDSSPFLDGEGRLIVVTSLFPVYDFAKIVGGDKASVSLILPPGSEAHSFLPQAKDLEIIAKSALFFYTSNLMEPWASSLVNKVSAKTQIISVGDNLNNNNLDPHIWLDFNKASLMVDNIASRYETVDPKNYSYYQDNAGAYKKKLIALDNEFKAGLKDCQFKEFVSGGHFTFDYLAKRYNLKYQAIQGFAPDSSVNIEKLKIIGKELKESGQPYVYYEEMIMPRLAEILHQDSGSKLLPLNAAHNVGKYDIESGITFIKIMENDLKILQTGLRCR